VAFLLVFLAALAYIYGMDLYSGGRFSRTLNRIFLWIVLLGLVTVLLAKVVAFTHLVP
jgi:uncharacterized membrane protein